MSAWLERLWGPAGGLVELLPGEPGLIGDAFLADGGGAWRAFSRKADLWLDGARTEQTPPLQHGQVIETQARCVVRYLTREPTPPVPRALRQLVAADPTDAFRWTVLADWLEEHGDERGLAVHGAPEDEATQARRFGPLARHVRDGNLVLTYGHGFPDSAVLRSLERDLHPSPEWCLARLLELDEAAFVQTLHVDLVAAAPDRVALEIVALLRTAAPPALRRLSLGPVSSIADERAVQLALGTLPFEATLLKFRECLIGDVEVTSQPQLAWFGGEPLAFTRTAHGPWLIRPEGRNLGPVRVNGRPCIFARLMHGDVIELGGGTRLTVTLR